MIHSKLKQVVKSSLATILAYYGIQLSVKKIFSASATKSNNQIFEKSKITPSVRGYLYLAPMPSKEELNKYYKSYYWLQRGDQSVQLHKRDLVHARLIIKLMKDCKDLSGLSVLNFGAGHGGISNLFLALGAKVVNIEPSMPENEEKQPYNYHSIRKLADKKSKHFDLFYSSHSLEHVSSIDDALADMKTVANQETLYFFEVPDASAPQDGGSTGLVDIPHTYYFRKEFFLNTFSEIIMLQTLPANYAFELEDVFSPTTISVPYSASDYGVIRCICKGLKNS